MPSLLQAFKKKRSATEADLSKEYRQILRHHDDENSGDDADRLVEICDRLKIDDSLVALHIAVISEHDRLVDESAPITDHTSELSEIASEREALERNYTETIAPALKAHRERIRELEELETAAKGALQTVEARRDQAKAIQAQFATIFGVDVDEKAKPWWQSATPAIREVQRKLGISERPDDHK